MSRMMKAAMWTGTDRIEVVEIPVPTPGPEEALVKVLAAGVCVTDYHVISGKLKIGHPPNVQGHEICGRVEIINSERKDILPGQRCVIATSLGCGHCKYCREGKQYLCEESSEIGYYPHFGGYAEYVKVPVSCIVPIPDEVSDLAGSILESSVCPTESLMNVGVPFAGTVVIAGAGPAALAYIMVSKILGAGKVISLVRGDYKSRLVRRIGADHAVDLTGYESPSEQVRKLTDGQGADLVIEATGAPQVISTITDYCKKGGKIIQYGIPGDDETVTIPIKKMIIDELTLYGAVGNTKAWYPLIDMISRGRLDLEQLVTHKFRLEDIDKAFDLYRNRCKELIKAVIVFDK